MDDFNNNNYTPAPRGDDNMEQPEAQQAAQPQESGQQSAQAPYRASDEPSVTPQGEQEAQPQQPYGAQGEQPPAERGAAHPVSDTGSASGLSAAADGHLLFCTAA